jgi:hypothetical protein
MQEERNRGFKVILMSGAEIITTWLVVKILHVYQINSYYLWSYISV